MASLRREVLPLIGATTVGGIALITGRPKSGTTVSVPSGTQIAQANRPAAPALPGGVAPSSAVILVTACGGPLYVAMASTQAGADMPALANAQAMADCKWLAQDQSWPIPYDASLFFNAFDCAAGA